jgi:hypothetical protein
LSWCGTLAGYFHRFIPAGQSIFAIYKLQQVVQLLISKFELLAAMDVWTNKSTEERANDDAADDA